MDHRFIVTPTQELTKLECLDKKIDKKAKEILSIEEEEKSGPKKGETFLEREREDEKRIPWSFMSQAD